MSNNCLSFPELDANDFQSNFEDSFHKLRVFIADNPRNQPCMTHTLQFMNDVFSQTKLSLISIPKMQNMFLSVALYVGARERSAVTGSITSFVNQADGLIDNWGLYFQVLRVYRVDVISKFRLVYLNSNFSHPREDAYAYFYYGSEMGDEESFDIFVRNLKQASSNAHDLIGFLTGMQDCKNRRLLPYILEYSTDSRRGIGVNGPGTGPEVRSVAIPIIERLRGVF